MSTQDIVAKLWNPLPFTSGNAKNTIQGVRVLESGRDASKMVRRRT